MLDSRALGVLLLLGAGALYMTRAGASVADWFAQSDSGAQSGDAFALWEPSAVAYAPTESYAPQSDTWEYYDDFSGVAPRVSIGYDMPYIFPSGEGGTVNYWEVNEYPKYAAAIREAEARHGIPATLFARQLWKETRYRADIISGAQRSPVGATGIAQFMPGTARDYGLIDAAGNDLRLDPFASIDAGARYMRDLYRRFGSWRDALMAYNWGVGNVEKWKRGERTNVPAETLDYVATITSGMGIA